MSVNKKNESKQSRADQKKQQVSEIKKQFKQLSPHLNERSKRLFAASEALRIGFGGISIVHAATGISRVTITCGCEEIKKGKPLNEGRVRGEGAGRQKVTVHYPGLSDELEKLLEPATCGDPEDILQWTNLSTRFIADELQNKGFPVCHVTVASLLEELGYSLQGNKKSIEGASHPDRDAQFKFINRKSKRFIKQLKPLVSVDCKKKENLGLMKNPGQSYRKKKEPLLVKGHDFPDKHLGKIVPYGVYDMAHNIGMVNLGIERETAQFACESIRRWLRKYAPASYPKIKELMITADSGGGNGPRSRLWKAEVQKLANEFNLKIHVSHFPPGTSKWNKVEHRLFSRITQNWRGRPLETYDIARNLIKSTTSETGLTVHCEVDKNPYPKGITVSDEEMKAINIEKNAFHGEWNYIISPQKSKGILEKL